MAETSDIRKPLCVAVVEGCLWAVALGMAALSFVMAARHGMPDRDDLLAAASLFAASLLPAGMALAIRRGRRGWFEGPFLLVMGLLLAPALAATVSEWRYGGGGLSSRLQFSVLVLLTTLVPIVLLRLPSSARWFAARSNGRKSRGGFGCLSLAVLQVILSAVAMSLSDSLAIRRAQVSSLALEARSIYVLRQRNAEARALGEPWVDPAACTNSVDYISRLVARFDANAVFKSRAPAPIWAIAVNGDAAPDLPDMVPVMVTANFDTAQIPQVWSGMHEPGVVNLKLRRVADLPACLGDQFVLLVRRCGSVQNFRARYLQPRVVFGKDPWQLPSGMYWLTPTGRTGP